MPNQQRKPKRDEKSKCDLIQVNVQVPKECDIVTVKIEPFKVIKIEVGINDNNVSKNVFRIGLGAVLSSIFSWFIGLF